MSYQTIYNQLRANGLTEAGALAMLGNWDCESNCESVRVQGDFSPYRTASKQYVADVDSNKISRDQFQNDQKGMGLAQWTYFTRKASLWDYCKNFRHCSIGDEVAQVDFAITELKTDFPGLFSLLKTSNDLYDCTKQVCYQFENPAVKNVDARYQAAIRIRGMIDLNPGPSPEPTPTPDPDPDPDPEPTPVPVYWPPRTIDKNCTDWPEVSVLNSILYCRGYQDETYELWDVETTRAVERFQSDNGLNPDGCAGPMTWGKLLAR